MDALLRVGMLGPEADESCKSFILDAAKLYVAKESDGVLHKLSARINEINLAAYGDEAALHEDEGVEELAYPHSDDEADSESEYE